VSLFKNKKTFAERNPEMAPAYSRLNAAQKKVLDEFSFLADRQHRAAKRVALQRIAEVVVIPGNAALSAASIRRRTADLYSACKVVLRNAELTTNVSAALFNHDAFLNSEEVKTVWTFKTNKTDHYFNKRQSVEENVFGYTVDWNVPIAQAAMTRPVYAGMNYAGHPYGAAAVYGAVCLVLKRSVNHRSTYISKDTFTSEFKFETGTPEEIEASRSKICTAAEISNIIAHLSNSQLKALCKRAEGHRASGDIPPHYIEAQVHGGIKWAKDLDAIRVATSGEASLAMNAKTANVSEDVLLGKIGQFAEQHGVVAGLYHQGDLVRIVRP